ncbi:hypothetical protein AYI69_g10562 [Smittium culicis]|uniref:Uncharacterized protein n=1 Tax=Smittium culicis TaxID=133412 RepID=A0A1R1X4V6_9FUNG|nr:hypothetical protein AYI69_g10562 [Smittium culicis]
MSQEQLKILTFMMQQLLSEREHIADPEAPLDTTRIPVTDLTVYPELTEAPLSIEKDFSRTSLTEEERKFAINSCPKTSSISYNPPQLKESAFHTVKKADSFIYRIQLALAQSTRPIENYVHHQIQNTSVINSDEGPEVIFASRMRVHLSDITATVTLSRLDTLYKGLDSRGVENPHLQETFGETRTNTATTTEVNSRNWNDYFHSFFHGRGRGPGIGSLYRPKLASQWKQAQYYQSFMPQIGGKPLILEKCTETI